MKSVHPFMFSLLLLAAVPLGWAVSSDAAENVSSATMERPRKFGLNAGLGDPFPGLFGYNVGYNFNDKVRITAGYAEIEVTSSAVGFGSGPRTESFKAQTFAAGAKYFFTDWAFRPNVGAHLGHIALSGDGTFSINGVERTSTYIYSNVGFDWITRSGFHLGTGMNAAIAGISGSGFYAHAGYFF